MELIFEAIENNHINTYDYLLSILHEELKNDSSYCSRLLRKSLRSSNTVKTYSFSDNLIQSIYISLNFSIFSNVYLLLYRNKILFSL